MTKQVKHVRTSKKGKKFLAGSRKTRPKENFNKEEYIPVNKEKILKRINQIKSTKTWKEKIISDFRIPDYRDFQLEIRRLEYLLKLGKIKAKDKWLFEEYL